MAQPLTTAQVQAALANAPLTPMDRKNAVLESLTYRSEVPSDTYRSALDSHGLVKRFGYDTDPSGALVRKPLLARKDFADGSYRQGERLVDRAGQPAFESTGQFVVASSGAEIRLYDSVINRLGTSADPQDGALWKALTGDNTHDVIFTGAIRLAIRQEVVDATRGYKQPHLVEA
ncbi:hypothetical protein SAMN00120144_2116 [Hymenobacter roseosalivarius DSM 11622]|uniref:Uncharacterized protein n=1 Tax=Hymenobacter roseosalivarius DSM 11622 TaxID=645990 RepID=A0A1W1VFP3_9BACT|nr:hypothetical protein [Hymenobacter roseosalivarius]SMB92198.1 hypothetical protein SAMN00120144_2116 [Hymenobacter roseosalivarius DSM 11622]